MAHGTWDSAFEPLVDAFRQNFAEHGEVGASLCVIVDGRTVVDAWAGVTSLDAPSPWSADTLVNAFSVGKGVTAALAAHCVASGHVSWESTIADLWPEFAAHGKGSLTLSDLLGHRAGLPGIREVLPDGVMLNWDQMTNHLADEAPWWEPGAAHGYHVNTFGFLVGETLRRATGIGVRDLFHERLFAPLGADLHMGLSPGDHLRVATLIWNDAPSRHGVEPPTGSDDEILQHRAYANPPGLSGVGWINSEPWRSATMPSTNMHASARGVAALFAALARPGLLLPAEVLGECATEISHGTDRVLGRRTRFGRGFQLPLPERSFGPSPRAFGHFGAGGSLGFTDPDAAVGFGYVMNKMGSGWQNERNSALVRSLYECL